MKSLILAFFGVSLVAHSASAYCPSYTPAETAGGQNCGVDPAPGTNPTIPAWNLIFAKVAPGKASWGADGPSSIGTMGSGCGKPKPTTQVPAHFPCHVLKAIAMQETGWRQFCVPDTPSASVGAPERTIVAYDCGYGIGQVTSGMHVGENPSFDRQRVVSEPTYNLATGTQILNGKWSFTNCVGDNDPDIVEDWYEAIWAYNGLAYVNNPNNPNLTPGRGVYNPSNGGSYTYQERVLGWMEHPPAGRWAVLAPAYPNRADVGGGGVPPSIPDPSCASPTDCVGKRSTHASVCDGLPPQPDAGPPPQDASVPLGPDASTPADDASAPVGAAPADVSGCSCRQSLSSNSSPIGLFVAGLALMMMRRRRARR